MTSIWQQDGPAYRLASPTRYPDEARLHTLVEQTPHMLPLAGSPVVVMLGREIQLGNGAADLIAIEPTGRLVVIEVKLAQNADARRAVVSQALAYAAFLKGIEPNVLEKDILGKHLSARGYKSLAEAVKSIDQVHSFDDAAFQAGLAACLQEGSFRVVFVLDQAPRELIRLVDYLGSLTDKLTIDLVTVSAYDIAGTQILVPQRVETDRQIEEVLAAPKGGAAGTYLAEGVDDFEQGIERAKAADQPVLRRLTDWAKSLEDEGLVRLSTYHGKSSLVLLPHLVADNVGLATIYNDPSGVSLQFWRSVFERRAPDSIEPMEKILHPKKLGQGSSTREISDELLNALTAAYREAARGKINV